MQKSFDSIAAIKAFVGQPAVSGEAITVDQDMINVFANITQDKQWIHKEPERAAIETPSKTTIAHGLLTLSLVTGWHHRCFAFPNRKLALNYGFDKIRFIAPVPSGSQLVGSFQLERVDDIKLDEVRCFCHVEMHIEGAQRPVMVATWLMQIRY
ncbi:MAG: MaoC family dehydratase [Burkholderiaceae bacterium]|nr:MaoC family dehydratase [Burkholderiaceae bacterium]